MMASHLFKLARLRPHRLKIERLLPAAFLFTLLAPAWIQAQAPTVAALPAAHNGAIHRQGSSVSGYLSDNEVNFLSILPPYPALDSPEDQIDVATLHAWQQPVNSARWRLAEDDANLLYSRFNAALGIPIDDASSPLLVHLLDRVEADISSALNGAKRYYNRPRPYQRFLFDHVCEFAHPPAPDMTNGGNSYPSGHAAFGWAIALTLAQAAPDKSQAVLARGREYGESRIVCAVHYPSDVYVAQILVSAVFGQVEAQTEFKRDMSCARQEYAIAIHARSQMDSECLALIEQFAKGR